MAAPPSPELAIVLVTPVAARLRKVLRCFRAQTDPERRELDERTWPPVPAVH
jgi:hypothetical protein